MSGVMVENGDFAISGSGKPSVKNTELVNVLVKDQPAALELLQKAAPSVSIDQVSIDDCGRVVVDNEEFKSFVSDLIANPVGAVGQGVCGYGCAGFI